MAVYSNNFLPISKAWLHRELCGVAGFRRIVLTRKRANEDLFPFDPVYCRSPRRRGHRREKREAVWRRALVREGARLVHAHMAHAALQILPVTRELGLPLLVTLHGNDVFRFGQIPWFQVAYQELFHCARGFLAVSESLRRAAIRLGCPAEKIRIHHLGVSLEDFTFAPRALSREEPVRFLSLGNFEPKKGIDVLLHAFRRVVDLRPSTRLVLAGYGRGLGAARALATDLGLDAHVEFPGAYRPERVPAAMRAHHVYVQPSRTAGDHAREGIPVVLMEAMATGMPVIATRHSGIPELVRDGISGWLVDEGDAGALAERMLALADSPETAARLGAAGRERVEREFDLRQQNLRLGRIYSELLCDERPRPEPRRRILLTNNVTLNGGDAAILLGMITGLRRAVNCEIRVLAHDTGRVAELYPELRPRPPLEEAGFGKARGIRGRRLASRFRRVRLAVRTLQAPDRCALPRGWRWLRRPLAAAAELAVRFLLHPREVRILNEYRACDAVVSSGGSYLTDFYTSVPSKLLGFEVARSFGRPLLIYGQSLGPLHAEGSRESLGRELRRAAWVAVRDDRSRKLALSLGVAPDRCVRTADAAFDLPPLAVPAKRDGDGLEVGLSVRRWKFPDAPDRAEQLMESYRTAVAALCEHLVRRHRARLTFVSTCQGVPGYADDSTLATEIAELLPVPVRKSVRVDGRWHHPLELREILAGFDLFVGTRMHALVLALQSHVPVVGIGYESKTRDLLERIGLGELVLPIGSLAPGALVACVDRALGQRRALARLLPERVSGLHREARRPAELLARLLYPPDGETRPCTPDAIAGRRPAQVR